ncbi:MFS transporter [Corynebacterium sp.]|uniref:MFS transporter n=1 Tax=Corynebacterium sp. TaxID=1720 RepID=UPI0026DA767E|nr:MFS transporter [Corynebacterium sp.]
MTLKTKTHRILALALLFFASVVDELIATVLLLEIDNGRGLWPSLLFAFSTAGALLASPLSQQVLIQGKNLTRMASSVLYGEAVVVLLCVYLYKNRAPILAILFGGALGLLGALLWVIVLLIVTESFEKQQFDSVNKWITTIRNAGFVVGPALGGLLYPIGSLYIYLASAGFCLVSASFALRQLPPPVLCPTTEEKESSSKTKASFSGSIVELLTLPRLAVRLLPPMGVAFFGSVVNVGIVIYLLDVQGRRESDYGLVGASISIGLVLGPVLIQAIAKRNTQIGIGLSGIITGAAIVLLFLPWNVVLALVSGFLLGIGNGGQNVSVTSLLMKSIPEDRRAKLIPAFVFCIYFFVFSSYIAGLFVTPSNVISLMMRGGVITILLGVFSITRTPLDS